MKCFVCICYSARCSLVSKLLTVSHAWSMKMNDDILVVVVSPDSKYIVVALLDCTMKLRAAIEKSTASFDKEKAQEWLSKISGGVVFKVRKASKTEVGERKDRVTDALNVTRVAVEEGMVPDEEDNLLQGINSYRQSLNVPALSENDKAGYLADEIADQLEHQPCMTTTSPITTASSSRSQITNFRDLLEKYNIDINTTRDGVIYIACLCSQAHSNFGPHKRHAIPVFKVCQELQVHQSWHRFGRQLDGCCLDDKHTNRKLC